MNYLIATEQNFADEFDYPVISLVDKEKLDRAINIVSQYGYDYEFEMGFGTNEDLCFRQYDLIEILWSAKPVTDAQVDFMKEHGLLFGSASLNVVDYIIEVYGDGS